MENTVAPQRGSAKGNRHSATGREMLTYSGRIVPLDAVKPAHIDLQDIAFHLAGTNRFGAAHPARPTVAEHSVAVLLLVRSYAPNAEALFAPALMHDAHEAYTGDMTGAIKLLLRPVAVPGLEPYGWDGSSSYDKLGDSIQAAITTRFQLPQSHHPLITRADAEACAYEMSLQNWAPNVTATEATHRVLDGARVYAQVDGGRGSFLVAARELGIR